MTKTYTMGAALTLCCRRRSPNDRDAHALANDLAGKPLAVMEWMGVDFAMLLSRRLVGPAIPTPKGDPSPKEYLIWAHGVINARPTIEVSS